MPRKKKKASPAQNGERGVTVARNQPSASVQQSVRIQQPVRTEPSAQAQSSTPVQPSTSAGRTAIQAVPSGPRRIVFRTVGPADDTHVQEGPARRGSAFPKGYKFPEGSAFKVRRTDEARAWDIEPSRAYIRHAVMEANNSDWEEPDLPWNSVPMGRYEGKLRTFTTPSKKFPGAQFIVN